MNFVSKSIGTSAPTVLPNYPNRTQLYLLNYIYRVPVCRRKLVEKSISVQEVTLGLLDSCFGGCDWGHPCNPRGSRCGVGAAVISTMGSLTTPGRNTKAVQHAKQNLSTLVRAGGAGDNVRKALHLCRGAWNKAKAEERSVLLCASEMEAVFLPCKDKPRKAISAEAQVSIEKFFSKEEISKVRPHLNREILVVHGERVCKNIKNAALPGAELRVLQFMNMTLTKAYQLFMTENPQFPHCQRTFF